MIERTPPRPSTAEPTRALTFETDEGTRYCRAPGCGRTATNITYPGSLWSCDAHHLAALLDASHVTTDGEYHGAKIDAQGWRHRSYAVTLRRSGVTATVTTPYQMGMAHNGPPSVAEVVASLLLDASYMEQEGTLPEPATSLEECRQALRMAERVREQYEALRAMFDRNEWDELELAAERWEG